MYLQKNLEAIKITNSGIAQQIEQAKNQNWINIIGDKRSNKNIIIKKGLKTFLAYPKNKPVSLAKHISESDIFFKDTATLLIGIGVGHLANAILKKKHEQHKVIIIEPVMFFLKETMSNYDFSKYIEDGSLYIATKKEEVEKSIYALDSIFVIQDWYVIAEAYISYCDEYSDISSYTIETINKLKCNTGTIMGAGKIIAENDIKNLPYIIRHRGINELKDIFKDKPAVLINTGPSLQKNIHLLTDIQDQVIIIAVAQALRVLLAYDITPDFICTVDYGEVNIEHFKGLMDSSVPLIVLNRTYAPILQQWQGTKFIVSSTTQDPNETVQNFIAKTKGSIPQGGSVSHLVFNSAIHMGCNPIVFMGLDLSYPNGYDSHIKLADARGNIEIDQDGIIKWEIDDPRSILKKDGHIMGRAVHVHGFFDDDVITNVGLASFITSFEAMFEQHKDKIIIDATEGGAKKKGTERMTLQKFIYTKLKKEKIDKKINFSFLVPNSDKLIDEVIPILESDIKILDDLIYNSKKGLETCIELLSLPDDENRNKQLRKLLKENEEYSNAAHNAAKLNNLIAVSIYDINRKIYNRELYVKGKINHLLKNEDDLKIRIERNQMILEASKNAGEHIKSLYENTLDILKAKDESLLSSKADEKISLDDAEEYLSAGNWAHPYLDCKKISETNSICLDNTIQISKLPQIFKQAVLMKEKAINQAKENYINNRDQDLLDYNKLVEEAREIGREEKNFEKALQLLKEADGIGIDKFEALWGLATACHHIGDIDNSITYYKKLISDFPDENRFKFEYGQVLLQKDFEAGIKEIEQVMNDTNEFDYFYAMIGNLYASSDIKKASLNYKKYLERYPFDDDVKAKLKNLT